jgi:hypothetical protein
MCPMWVALPSRSQTLLPNMHSVRTSTTSAAPHFSLLLPLPQSQPLPLPQHLHHHHATARSRLTRTALHSIQVQNLIKHLYHRYPRCRVCVLVNRWERQYVLLSLGVHWTHLLHQPPTTSPYTPNVTCAPAVNTPRTMGHLGPGHHGIVGHVNAGAKSIRIASRCNIPL